ncbi:MAG: amidohydrolase family protein [Pyrinomonadaceae bacterium]
MEGVVACARPEKSGFREYLENFARHPRLKGIRRIFHTQPDELILHPVLIDNLRALPDYSLSFDLCVPARPPTSARHQAGETCPRPFHTGSLRQPPIKEHAPDPWRAHLQAIANLPNVVCKVSGLVTNADHKYWTAADLQPYIDHVIESFGWDRVMFGSDWPVCTPAASYQIWLETALARLTQSNNIPKNARNYSPATPASIIVCFSVGLKR